VKASKFPKNEWDGKSESEGKLLSFKYNPVETKFAHSSGYAEQAGKSESTSKVQTRQASMPSRQKAGCMPSRMRQTSRLRSPIIAIASSLYRKWVALASSCACAVSGDSVRYFSHCVRTWSITSAIVASAS